MREKLELQPVSIQSTQSNIQRVQDELSSLQGRLSNESGNEADKAERIARIQGSLSPSMSASTRQSRLRESARLQSDLAAIQKKKSDLNKRIAEKTRDLHRYQADLVREQEREQKKIDAAEQRRRGEQRTYLRQLDQQLHDHRRKLHELGQAPNVRASEVPTTYDLFISHASEDKDDFVRPLAEALTARGLRVWYDEFQLRIGDSLRQSIDRGLANSRYGVVVLSSSFFAKNWPQYELNGLVAREMNGIKVILPIWHKVTKNDVLAYSPSLADKVALNSSLLSIDEIAKGLADIVAT